MGQLVQQLHMVDRTTTIEGQNSLILVEPGYDAVVSGKFAGSSVEQILQFSKKIEKPIQYIIFSHAHGDHVGNLPFYLKRLTNLKKLIAHENSPLLAQLQDSGLVQQEQIATIDYKGEKIGLDGVPLDIVATPGHSFHQDDISLYFPRQQTLFAGDLFQPQGVSYDKGVGVSPLPFFYNGDHYLNSLNKLLEVDFQTFITGHGEVLNQEKARNGLFVTRQCIIRMKELSSQMIAQYPKECLETICEWIYDAIVWERRFDKEKAEERKNVPNHHRKSDYEIYDRPGLKYFVHQAKENSTKPISSTDTNNLKPLTR